MNDLELKTIDIKGKKYVTVNERLKAFRNLYAKYSLETEIVELNATVAIFKAIIKDENGRIIATGVAREEQGSSYINNTSYVENAETSAWGRALGNLGIGLDTSIASADELVIALAGNKPKNKPQAKPADYNRTKILARIEELRNPVGAPEDIKKAISALIHDHITDAEVKSMGDMTQDQLTTMGKALANLPKSYMQEDNVANYADKSGV